jgi:hypothetical protein
MFFNSRDKVEINFIKNSCASHMLLKKSNTCHFYRLGWRRFFQPSLEENFVLKLKGEFCWIALRPTMFYDTYVSLLRSNMFIL